MNRLQSELRRIDHRGYPAYKDLRGSYDFGKYILNIEHIQGDPFASPSSLSVKIKGKAAGFPKEYYNGYDRKTAFEDFILRRFSFFAAGISFKAKGSGKSGMVSASRPGQEIMERSACKVDESTGDIILRFVVGFPAGGRSIDAGELEKILFRLLPGVVEKSGIFKLFTENEKVKLKEQIELSDDQKTLRKAVGENGFAAFIADGSILPRESGVSERPMKNAVLFKSPESMRVTFELPHKGKITGIPVDLRVDRDTMDREFDILTRDLPDSDKAELSKRVNMQAIMYNEKRIHKVCAHIAKHFTEKIRPNGYKAQVVVYDRPCCLKYKAELDKLLGEECSTIVMDTNDDKADEYKKYRRSKDEEAKILDRFRDPNDPLEIVIVTAKLLTGFDAPILQVMYLDKPMKDHTLLQAICRTNRTFDEGKTHGLIVDYIGIFDNVAKALDFDEGSMKKVITNIEEVKKQIPALLRKCLSYFMGVDRTVDGWEGLMAAQECLPTNAEKDKFAADYQVLNRAWNAVSPDPMLSPIQVDYVWLTKVFESVKPTNGGGGLIWAALGPKTMEIVNSNMDVGEVHEDEEILSLDAELIDAFIEKHKGAKNAAKKVEIDLVARIHKHSDDPKFMRLGDKLEKLREQHEQGLINSIEFLKMLLELAREAAQAEKEVVPEEEVDKGKAALTELFNGVKNTNTPVIVERIVTDIDDIVKIVRFDGWQNTTGGRQEVKKALRSVVWVKYKIKDKEVFDKAYSYIEQYY